MAAQTTNRFLNKCSIIVSNNYTMKLSTYKASIISSTVSGSLLKTKIMPQNYSFVYYDIIMTTSQKTSENSKTSSLFLIFISNKIYLSYTPIFK